MQNIYSGPLCFNRLFLLLGLFSSLDTLDIDPFEIHGLADVTLDCLPSSWKVRRQVVFRPTSKGSQLWFPKIYFIAGVFLNVECRSQLSRSWGASCSQFHTHLQMGVISAPVLHGGYEQLILPPVFQQGLFEPFV